MNATLAPAPVKTKRRHLFTLEATIDEASYAVYPVRDIQDEEIAKAFTFAKRTQGGAIEGQAVYTVARHADGRLTCECPDFVTRHEDKGTLCKHGECCVRMGLLDAPVCATAHKPEPIPPAPTEPIGSIPSPADRLRSSMFGIALPKPQAAPRAFAEGLLDESPAPAPEPCCSPSEASPCAQCLGADDTDAGRLVDFLPTNLDGAAALADHDPDRLSLAELVEAQARAFRAWNLGAADLMAERLEELAAEVRLTNAATPDQFRDRIDVIRMDEDRRLIAFGEDVGFADGLAAADRRD